MAISFARLTIHSRSKGHSAVAAAAYRSGAELYDERTGEIHDYQNRKDVLHEAVLLPENTHEKFKDRLFLWNQVELSERRKDAQLAKELTLALPKELDTPHHIKLIQHFAHEHFLQHGLAVDTAIHDKGDGNPHAHLLITTRRIEFDHLSSKKARDLNPVFYGGSYKKIYDLWSQKWRDCQNNYFHEHKIDLTVDAEYLIPTRHQGRVRSEDETHFLRNENKIRRELSLSEVAQSPQITLEHLSSRFATFTEKDIASFLFRHTTSQKDYQQLMQRVLSDRHLITLGYGEDGRIRYTTRQSFLQEQRMISQSQAMTGRRGKAISTKAIKRVAASSGLQTEQHEAIQYLLQKGDIACLVGRAGTGKTYTMKAAHQLYKEKGYSVYGAALSGIAAKALESSTGIKSDTIYSLTKRINESRFQPKPGSVLIIDEAGMVALNDMATIVKFAKRSHCKLILLGDPDQLQPIMAGAPFRAILSSVGFIEMKNIQRQVKLREREASSDLAAGRIGRAIDYYSSQNQLELASEEHTQKHLIAHWSNDLSQKLENRIILAHTRAQVADLNFLARARMLSLGLIPQKGHDLTTSLGTITLAKGDRIVFLKNNYDLGVCNGDFATITAIQGSNVSARLGDKNIQFNSKHYNDFNYGYAVTVHKSQGTTFDQAFVYLDGGGWDRHLSYVALTRHRHKLRIYANKDRYRSLDKLKRQLARSPIRDNAIDYPLSFAQRRGFDSTSLLGRALNHIAGMKNSIKDSWLYLRNYESWILKRDKKRNAHAQQLIRKDAKLIVDYVDIKNVVGKAWSMLYKTPNHKQSLPYPELLQLTSERNELALTILRSMEKYRAVLANHHISVRDLSKQANRHLRQLTSKNNSPTTLTWSELINQNEWKNLQSCKGKQLRESIKLINSIREKLQGLTDEKKIQRLSCTFNTLVNKILSSKHQKQELRQLTPELYKKIKTFYFAYERHQKHSIENLRER